MLFHENSRLNLHADANFLLPVFCHYNANHCIISEAETQLPNILHVLRLDFNYTIHKYAHTL